MIFYSGPTQLRGKQIRLSEIFSVERILSSRGFAVTTEGNGLDTILPKSDWHISEADLMFEVFDNRDKRAELLSLCDGSAQSSTDQDVQAVANLGGINLSRSAFSTTFEWYVGELLVRRFGSFSSSYGVKVSDIIRNSDGGTSGDFDVLSVLGTMDVIYIECKSGKFKGKKIANMLERARSLHTLASIMFVENFSETSLKGKIAAISYPGISARPDLINGMVRFWT